VMRRETQVARSSIFSHGSLDVENREKSKKTNRGRLSAIDFQEPCLDSIG
jgi:hypothetical protein